MGISLKEKKSFFPEEAKLKGGLSVKWFFILIIITFLYWVFLPSIEYQISSINCSASLALDGGV